MRLQWFAIPLFIFCAALHAESATVEIQGVSASDPGKTPNVPAALAQYKTTLTDTVFGTFKDAGHQAVKAGNGTKGSANIGKYSVDVAVAKVEGRSKVEVTVNEGGKPITSPLRRPLTQGKRFSIQIGSKDAPTILIFTIKDAD